MFNPKEIQVQKVLIRKIDITGSLRRIPIGHYTDFDVRELPEGTIRAGVSNENARLKRSKMDDRYYTRLKKNGKTYIVRVFHLENEAAYNREWVDKFEPNADK